MSILSGSVVWAQNPAEGHDKNVSFRRMSLSPGLGALYILIRSAIFRPPFGCSERRSERQEVVPDLGGSAGTGFYSRSRLNLRPDDQTNKFCFFVQSFDHLSLFAALDGHNS